MPFVSWDRKHTESEQLAVAAEHALKLGQRDVAEDYYRRAALAETSALAEISRNKERTLGITAVSAVALWYKGHNYDKAEALAHAQLAKPTLPLFARKQLRELLDLIWTGMAAEEAGVKFAPGDVLVSIKGGEIIHGGAPLDLIVQKVEGIKAVLFRTVEMLLNQPFRRRGGPSVQIQSMFRPWLFQAPAGSYQFAVRVQEPPQMELSFWPKPTLNRVTDTFFRVLRASSCDPEQELPKVVEDKQYREAFISLSRNLSPTGKSFEQLEVRDASTPNLPIVAFAIQTRQQLNAALRATRSPRNEVASDEPVTIKGILRALHLDQDWLEVTSDSPGVEHIKVEEAGEALDDVIGPMVNRRVNVMTVRRGQKYIYRDLELDE